MKLKPIRLQALARRIIPLIRGDMLDTYRESCRETRALGESAEYARGFGDAVVVMSIVYREAARHVTADLPAMLGELMAHVLQDPDCPAIEEAVRELSGSDAN